MQHIELFLGISSFGGLHVHMHTTINQNNESTPFSLCTSSSVGLIFNHFNAIALN